MLKIFFSLLICVLGHSSSLDNITKEEDLGGSLRVDSSVANEALPVNTVNTLSKEEYIYKKAYPVNFHNFPKYDKDVILSKMQNSLLYILVPVHCPEYIDITVEEINQCMLEHVMSIDKAAKALPEGCIVYPIFRVDGSESHKIRNAETLKRILKETQIPEEAYDVSVNPESIREDLTRQALIDRMVEINDQKYKDSNRNTYFLFMYPGDVFNKSAFQVFLSVGLLREDKWAFDFEYCFRSFEEDNQSEVVLDTDLSLEDFCYRHYHKRIRKVYDGYDRYIGEERNFDKYGFFNPKRFGTILGYPPALYKYDKTRVQVCKKMLEEDLEHFSPGYADNKNLNKCGTTAAYHCPEDDVIPAGYFAVFPKGFDTLTGEERGKKGALYYFRY